MTFRFWSPEVLRFAIRDTRPGADPEKAFMHQELPLMEVKCLECYAVHKTRRAQLKFQVLFSCLTCHICRNVNVTSKRRCRCQLLLYKHPVHVHEQELNAKVKATVASSNGSSRKRCRAERIDSERGIVCPMPRYRKSLRGHACIEHVPSAKRAFIREGSILTTRFPHLAKRIKVEDG